MEIGVRTRVSLATKRQPMPTVYSRQQRSATPTEVDGDGTAEAVKTKVHADRTLQLDTCQPSLASLSTDINDIKETLKAVLAQSSQITEVNKLLKSSEDKLDQYLDQTRLLKDNVTRIETRLVRVEEYIRSDKENKLRELRQKNIISRGVPESDSEKMHVVMTDLLNKMGASFAYSATHGAIRLGNPTNQTQAQEATGADRSPYIRPIKLRLSTTQQKSELAGIQKNAKHHEKYKNIRLFNDYNDEELLVHKEARQIYNAALKNKEVKTTSLHGTAVFINGTRYDRSNYDNLPCKLTKENVSTILTGDGVAFQGHFSPLSNFYRCNLKDTAGVTLRNDPVEK